MQRNIFALYHTDPVDNSLEDIEEAKAALAAPRSGLPATGPAERGAMTSFLHSLAAGATAYVAENAAAVGEEHIDGSFCLKLPTVKSGSRPLFTSAYVHELEAPTKVTDLTWSKAKRVYPALTIRYGGKKLSPTLVVKFLLPNPLHWLGHHASHRCHDKMCVNPQHICLLPSAVNTNSELGCGGGDHCLHTQGGEGFCLESGTFLGSQEDPMRADNACFTSSALDHELDTFLAGATHIVDHHVPEHFVGDGDALPYDAESCTIECLEATPEAFGAGLVWDAGATSMSMRARVGPLYHALMPSNGPCRVIRDGFFRNRPVGMRGKEWSGTHPCHNKKCLKRSHIVLASEKYNHGTNACPGGTFCHHEVGAIDNRCIFPGSQCTRDIIDWHAWAVGSPYSF